MGEGREGRTEATRTFFPTVRCRSLPSPSVFRYRISARILLRTLIRVVVALCVVGRAISSSGIRMILSQRHSFPRSHSASGVEEGYEWSSALRTSSGVPFEAERRIWMTGYRRVRGWAIWEGSA